MDCSRFLFICLYCCGMPMKISRRQLKGNRKKRGNNAILPGRSTSANWKSSGRFGLDSCYFLFFQSLVKVIAPSQLSQNRH